LEKSYLTFCNRTCKGYIRVAPEPQLYALGVTCFFRTDRSLPPDLMVTEAIEDVIVYPSARVEAMLFQRQRDRSAKGSAPDAITRAITIGAFGVPRRNRWAIPWA